MLEREDPRDALISAPGLQRLCRICRPERGSARAACAAGHSSRMRVRTSCLSSCVATCPRASRNCSAASTTRSCSPRPASSALGWMRTSRRYLPTREFPSAVSQGAIGVCAREGDRSRCAGCTRWTMPPRDSRRLAERALLRKIEGGCQVPLGALATLTGAPSEPVRRGMRARWLEDAECRGFNHRRRQERDSAR